MRILIFSFSIAILLYTEGNILAQEKRIEIKTKSKTVIFEDNALTNNSSLLVKVIKQIGPKSELLQFGLSCKYIEFVYSIDLISKRVIPLSFLLSKNEQQKSYVYILRFLNDSASNISISIDSIPVFSEIKDSILSILNTHIDTFSHVYHIDSSKPLSNRQSYIFKNETRISELLFYDGKFYSYQISSFKKENRAKNLMNELKMKNIKSFYYKIEPQKGMGNWFRVRVGPYKGTDILREKLKKINIELIF